MANANPPPGLRQLPKEWFNDPEKRAFLQQVTQILFQLWNRTGGGTDTIETTVLRETYAWMSGLDTDEGDTFNSYAGFSDIQEEGFSYPQVSEERFEWFVSESTNSYYQMVVGEWLKANTTRS